MLMDKCLTKKWKWAYRLLGTMINPPIRIWIKEYIFDITTSSLFSIEITVQFSQIINLKRKIANTISKWTDFEMSKEEVLKIKGSLPGIYHVLVFFSMTGNGPHAAEFPVTLKQAHNIYCVSMLLSLIVPCIVHPQRT